MLIERIDPGESPSPIQDNLTEVISGPDLVIYIRTRNGYGNAAQDPEQLIISVRVNPGSIWWSISSKVLDQYI